MLESTSHKLIQLMLADKLNLRKVATVTSFCHLHSKGKRNELLAERSNLHTHTKKSSYWKINENLPKEGDLYCITPNCINSNTLLGKSRQEWRHKWCSWKHLLFWGVPLVRISTVFSTENSTTSKHLTPKNILIFLIFKY